MSAMQAGLARRRRLPLAVLALALCASPAQAQVQAATQQQAPAGAEDYRPGPGDLLRISVAGHPDLAAELRVSPAGAIRFPYVGELRVAGETLAAVERAIAARLADGFIQQPQVSALVLEFESRQIGVLGQVNKPGKFRLQGGSRVLDMLAEAGGLVAATADDTAVVLRRGGGKSQVDLRALFEGDETQNLSLAPGDTLMVPRAPQFYLYGEVQRPGVYRLERDMTVAQAIAAGGGLTPRGTERGLSVRRVAADGREQTLRAGADFRLQPGDVMQIHESLF